MMPIQKPGLSKQDYGTPDDFMDAVTKRFGPMTVDLAASEENKVCYHFIGEEENSLLANWSARGGSNMWLNPPYAKIGPWAKKCEDHSIDCNIFMLVPAAVGSNWYMDYVHGKAYVLALNPRLKFKGCKDAYVKDCILCCYGPEQFKGFDVWRWK